MWRRKKNAQPQNSKQPQDPNKCCVCCEDISVGAKKCIHCGCWQNWRGRIGLSQDVLALLVALGGLAVSAATIAAPVLLAIRNARAEDNSALRFDFVSSASDTITAMVTNAGIRPGIVTGATIEAVRGAEKKVWTLYPTGASPAVIVRGALVDPQRIELLAFRAEAPPEPHDPGDQGPGCFLNISYRNFKDAANSNVTLQADCPKLIKYTALATFMKNGE